MAFTVHPENARMHAEADAVRSKVIPAETRVPVVAFVSSDYHVMISKSGDLVAFYETEGIDNSCLSEAELAAHHAVLNTAYNEADMRVSIHQYFVKDEAEMSVRQRDYVDGVVRAVDAARQDALSSGKFYTTRMIYAFEWKSSFSRSGGNIDKLLPMVKDAVMFPFSSAARKSFRNRMRQVSGSKDAVNIQEKALLEEIQEFQSAMRALTLKIENVQLDSDVDANVTEGIGPARLELEPLCGVDAYQVLHRIYNWDRGTIPAGFLPSPSYLAHWIPRDEIGFGHPNVITCGRRLLRVYSFRGFRDPVDYDLLGLIRSVRGTIMLHTRFAKMSIEGSSKLLAGKIADANNLGGFTRGDPLKRKRIEDLEVALSQSVRNRPFGEWYGQIVLAGDTFDELEEVCRMFEGVCSSAGIVVRLEGMSKDCAFHALMPFSREYEFMTRTVQTAFATGICMPYRQAEGRGVNPPRGCIFPEALCILNTYSPGAAPGNRLGMPINFYIGVADLNHFAVFGQSGGGKSFLVNFLETNWGRYSGTKDRPKPLKRWIIDRGHSYKPLCELMKGAYINVGDPDTSAKMNPFDLSPDQLKHQVEPLTKFVELLIAAGSTAEITLSEKDARDIQSAIVNMAEDVRNTGRLGSLQMLTTYLGGSAELVSRLASFLPGGPFAHIFPEERDGLGNSDFTVFNFSAEFISENNMGPIFYYLLHRIRTTVESKDYEDAFKMAFIDEAAVFLTPKDDWKSKKITSELRNFIREAWKTWRKHGGTIGLATQEPGDFSIDPVFWASFKSAVPTKIFLKQKSSPALTNKETGLGIPEHIASKMTEYEKGVFLVDQAGMRRILKLEVDPTSYSIYTTDPVESQFRSRFLASRHYTEDYTTIDAFGELGKIFVDAKKSGRAIDYLLSYKV